MNLLSIILGTLAAGVGSVWLAGLLTYGVLARYTQHLLSLAAGALLATAFMNLLPEAFESKVGAQALFATLLAGLIFFFLLDKAELYHHGHEHSHGEAHAHDHAHHDHAHDHHDNHHAKPTSGGWAVLLGDSVHCFGDCAWAWPPPWPCWSTRCPTTWATWWCCASPTKPQAKPWPSSAPLARSRW
jgi:zinc and cadmium transporter